MNGTNIFFDWVNRKVNQLVIRAMVLTGVDEGTVKQTIENMANRQALVNQGDKKLRMKINITKILIISLIVAAGYFLFVKFIKPRIKK